LAAFMLASLNNLKAKGAGMSSLPRQMTFQILSTRSCLAFFLVAGLLLSLSTSPYAHTVAVKPGHSAHWFDPERSGEGLVLEVLDTEKAVVYWFTYDEAGNQRWLIDVGDIEENVILFPTLTVTEGGKFGPDYNPDDVEMKVVGYAEFQVGGCNSAEWSFNAFGKAQTQTMTRLTHTMGADCETRNGIPGYPVKEYAGQSGSWFDPTHSGEGLTLQWMSRDEAVLVWFTYDAEGNQRWMNGVGRREENRILFPSLQSTTGGRFGEPFDSEDLISSDWGSLTLEVDCDQGVAQYHSSEAAFGTGQFALVRLSSLGAVSCPWQRPEITDLYEFDLETIYEGQRITLIGPSSITNDGVIVGVGNHLLEDRHMLRWSPETEKWTTLPEQLRDPRISADGSRMLAKPMTGQGSWPMIWNESSGWRSIANNTLSRAEYFGASRSLTWVVGEGRLPEGGPGRTWLWSEESGEVLLPVTEDIPGATPRAVADDGSVVIGNSMILSDAGPLPFREVGVRWKGSAAPHFLRDSLGRRLGRSYLCNIDCSIIFGAEQAVYDPEHPNYREAWYWTESTGADYIGIVEGAVDYATVAPALPLSTTTDGTMMVGSYPLFNHAGRPGVSGFLWTMNTGIVSFFDIFEQLDIGSQKWDSLRATISADGSMIVLSGYERTGPHSYPTHTYRVQLLRLTERDLLLDLN